MTHIKELWLADKDPDASIYRIRSNGKFLFEIHDPLNTNIARRVVACVNACEGIDTLQLEILDVKTTLDGADELIKLRDQLKQQRDKLLAALKATLPLLKGHQETPEKVARYSNALAAIAEIEAAQS